MDQSRYISRRTEPGIAADSVNKQSIDAIESVANKLAIIGDELSQSYEELSRSGGAIPRPKTCATLEGCMDILLLVLKA